jgi:prevent-host-death family protein
MRTVNIAELKNRLSTYITYAKAGETIVIRDRNTPVAQLVPLPVDESISQEERELVAAGILHLGRRPWEEAFEELCRMPIAEVQGNALTQAILDEREEEGR